MKRPTAAVSSGLREGAVLHWRILLILAVQLGLYAVESVLLKSPGLRSGSIDPTVVVLAAMVALYLVIVATVYRLAAWLGFNGAVWAGGLLVPFLNALVLVVLLKRSVTYFNSQGLRAGLLGPNRQDVDRADKARKA